jgi:hypothetical protein
MSFTRRNIVSRRGFCICCAAATAFAGRSLDETIAAKPTAAFDAKWGQFVIDPAFFRRLVYQGA